MGAQPLHVMEFKWDQDGGIKDGIGGNDAELISAWPGSRAIRCPQATTSRSRSTTVPAVG